MAVKGQKAKNVGVKKTQPTTVSKKVVYTVGKQGGRSQNVGSAKDLKSAISQANNYKKIRNAVGAKVVEVTKKGKRKKK